MLLSAFGANRGSRVALAFVAMLSLLLQLGLMAPPAEANHPTGSCLDIDPETGGSVVAGAIQSVEAILKSATDPFPAPLGAGGHCEGAAMTVAPTGSPVRISFELSGAANDTDGDTPDSPDFSCFILPGASSCTGTYPANKAGIDTVRGWIDHDGKAPNEGGVTEADRTEPQNADTVINDATEPDETDVVTRDTTAGPASRLDCDDLAGPDTENETNPSGGGPASTENYTCLVTDDLGNPKGGVTINGENETGVNDPDATDGASYSTPDYTCSSGAANGRCTMAVTQGENEVGNAVLCFWVGPAAEGANLCSPTTANGNVDPEPTGENQADDGSDIGNDTADQVELRWETPGASRLEAEIEVDVRPLGTTQTVTVAVYNQAGQPFNGITQVNFEFFLGSPSDADASNNPSPSDGNGPASPDKICVTNNAATCSITYSHAGTTGADLICAWVNNTPVMSGNSSNGTCEGDVLNEPGDAPGTFEPPEPDDDQDVVQRAWQSATQASRLDCTPETATNPAGSLHAISCTARNSSQSATAGVPIDVEASGTNDPDDGYSPETPDFTCQTASDGTCSISHGQTQTATVNTNGAGTTSYTAWLDIDGNNASTEADPTEGRNEAGPAGNTPEPDGTDVVEKIWQGEARTIACEPRSATNDTGRSHTIRCTLRDRAGETIAGADVTFSEDGSGFLTSSSQAFSDGQGRVAVTVTSTEAGTQSVTATITDDLSGGEPSEVDECDRSAGDPVGAGPGQCSDTVLETWVEAPEPEPGRCDIVGTQGDDTLRGTARGEVICGRGGNDTIRGRGGKDTLIGGPGKDRLEGGKGGDKLVGGRGNDKLFGGKGTDDLRGGRGQDQCDGGPGRDKESGCEDKKTTRAAVRRRYV